MYFRGLLIHLRRQLITLEWQSLHQDDSIAFTQENNIPGST